HLDGPIPVLALTLTLPCSACGIQPVRGTTLSAYVARVVGVHLPDGGPEDSDRLSRGCRLVRLQGAAPTRARAQRRRGTGNGSAVPVALEAVPAWSPEASVRPAAARSSRPAHRARVRSPPMSTESAPSSARQKPSEMVGGFLSVISIAASIGALFWD